MITPGCYSLQVILYRFTRLVFLWHQYIHCRLNFIFRPGDKELSFGEWLRVAQNQISMTQGLNHMRKTWECHILVLIHF